MKNEDFNTQWTTTANMPKRLYGSHGLEAWGYRLAVHKGDFGKSNDWSEWSQEMHDYMVQDTLGNPQTLGSVSP